MLTFFYASHIFCDLYFSVVMFPSSLLKFCGLLKHAILFENKRGSVFPISANISSFCTVPAHLWDVLKKSFPISTFGKEQPFLL